MSTLRWLVGLVSPWVWLLLAAWLFLQVEALEAARAAAAPYTRFFCFGALGAAALLSWYYHRSRMLLAAVVVGLLVWGWEALTAAGTVPKLAAVFLLPLNFVLFAWLKERDVLTPSGILKVGLVAAQVLGVVLLGEVKGGRLEAFLRWGERTGGWSWMPLAEQLVFAAAALALLALAFRRRTKVEAGLLWALVAAFLALNEMGTAEATHVYAGAAGLVLVFAVLEHGYEVAYRDELTALPGRRALNEFLPDLGRRYAIAMCDVDHFKNFNDTYGHEAGDQVLRMVAAKLSQIPGGGRAFRYGGEEFTIVFPDRTAKEALPLVEVMRQVIATTAFVLRAPDRPKEKPKEKLDPGPKKTVTITISIGVAERSKTRARPELVLEAADTALYAAKESGRNCVQLA